MFCSECGFKIEDSSIRFCPMCGTRISSPEFACSGIVFTNVNLLSESLRTDHSRVLNAISYFIDRKRDSGVEYKLVDVGNYTYQKKAFLGLNKTARLKKDSPISEYMDILRDVRNATEKEDSEEIQYMFIIGGCDVIPMFKVKHFVPDGTDKDIDTDILWSYPYGTEVLEELQNQNLFKYKPLYLAGRLPMAEEGTIEDLCNYLERDIESSSGILMTAAYGQCDPNWMLVSDAVASTLGDKDYLQDLSHRLPPDLCYRGMLLSPNITTQNVNSVLNKNASFYYFNLHGSDGYESKGYFGYATDGTWGGSVIEPEQMMACEVPSIVFSEACYGARFIGMDKKHSMMLASLFTKALVFVGSSRIAWGALDAKQDVSSDTINIDYADILANQFIDHVLQGATVAEAFFMARSVLLCHPSPAIRMPPPVP